MKTGDLRTLDDKGLLLRQQDLLGELTSMKFQQATGQLENTAKLKTLRRGLARVNTILRQREIEQGLAAGSIAATAGVQQSDGNVFAAFRKAMGQAGD